MSKLNSSKKKLQKAQEIWRTNLGGDPKYSVYDEEELVGKLLDFFHIGPYYYFIFNSKTFKNELVGSSSSFKILEYDVNELTLEVIIDRIHPEDLPYFYAFEKDAQRFYKELPSSKHFKYKFSYDVRILDKDETYKRILMQIIPFAALEGGGGKTLNIMTQISHLKQEGKPSLSYIGMEGEPSFYDVDPQIPVFDRAKDSLFTKREVEILRYIIAGKTSLEISKELFISKLTVDTHRRNILAKSGCDNIKDLITKSVKNGWV